MSATSGAGPNVSADDMWKGYKPTMIAAPEASTTARNTADVAAQNLPPTPPTPPRLRKPQTQGGSQQTHQEYEGKGGKPSGHQKGKTEEKGTWRPRLREQNTTDPQMHDPDHAQHRFTPTGTYGKGGKEKGKDKSKGGKHQEGKSYHEGKSKSKGKSSGSGKSSSQGSNWSKGRGKRYHDATIAYVQTGIYGNEDATRPRLRANYPDQYNNALTEFWQDDRGEWFVRWRYE